MKKLILLFLASIVFCACEKNKQQAKKNNDNNIELEVEYLKKSRLPVEIIASSIEYLSPSFVSRDSLFTTYELNLRNTYDVNIKLEKVEIYDIKNRNQPIVTLDKEYFEKHAEYQENDAEFILGPFEYLTINIHLKVPLNKLKINKIFHNLIVGLELKESEFTTVPMEVSLIDFQTQTNLEFGFPFKSGRWIYGAESHMDAPSITEGVLSYPQRYALDWVKLDENNLFFKEDSNKLENWVGYGEEILAIEDGIIAEVKDSIPENKPYSDEMPVRLSRETISGNYIRLDIGNNLYVHYAHLIPGSLKYKVGDKVNKGDVIGLLGNSGSSDLPHLHIHIERGGKCALAGEGIPYHFDRFKFLNYLDENNFDNFLFQGKQLNEETSINEIKQREFLERNGIIEF